MFLFCVVISAEFACCLRLLWVVFDCSSLLCFDGCWLLVVVVRFLLDFVVGVIVLVAVLGLCWCFIVIAWLVIWLLGFDYVVFDFEVV